MLHIGPAEIFVVLALALVFLGPRRLPEVAKQVGRFMGEIRRTSDELRRTLDDEVREEDREKRRREFAERRQALREAADERAAERTAERAETLPDGEPVDSLGPPAAGETAVAEETALAEEISDPTIPPEVAEAADPPEEPA